MRLGAVAATLAAVTGLAVPVRASEPTAAQVEFFEKKIRPVLANNCYGCHNSKLKTPLGGLRLDTREAMLRGGDSGPSLVAGDPDASRLIKVISYRHEMRMPPTGKLPDEDIANLTEWIRMGAPDPRASAPAPPTTAVQPPVLDRAKTLWSLQPVHKPAIPKFKRQDWVESPIDAFILAKLEEKGLAPAVPASKRALLRRVTYDLIGLPPTPAEMDAFLNDKSPDAFAKVVERLLASPHYGERWGRHWLDLVRYAETNGHEYDNDKLDPWRYRDYVIRAFNDDVPYDQFIREHIAGDLLPAKRLRSDGSAYESPLGTTAFWFGEVLNSATDSVKSRADEVDNQIDVLTKAFQGLTVACARCHDHKFDPIPTSDYYAMAGVLYSTDLREAALDSPERAAEIRRLSARIRELAPVREGRPSSYYYRDNHKVFERFTASFGEWVTQGAAFGEGPVSGAADSRAAGSDVFVGTLTSPKFRTRKELYLHVRMGGTKSDRRLGERGPLRFTIVADGYKGQHIVPDGDDGLKWRTLKLTFERERICYFEIVDRSREGHIAVDEIVFSPSPDPPDESDNEPPEISNRDETLNPEMLAAIRDLEAQVPPSAFAMIAEDRDCADAKLHIRGNHKNLGPAVPRRFLQAVSGEDQSPVTDGSGRLAIAERIANPSNPLTARVAVNRIWSHHFGKGLVRSADNFGVTGDEPTHPELLDYLATRFVESGWSIKAMHRLMVLSSTYMMSSTASEEASRIDPTNKLLSHMPVRRLEAEAIRDTMLTLSGTFDPALFGPSVPPHISKWQDGRGKPQSGPVDGNGRRSIYIQVRRNFMTPMFLAFDYPLPISTMGVRTVSTVPSQALLLMNNELVADQASKWASKVTRETDPTARIQRMYHAAFARPANDREVQDILAFVSEQMARPEAEVWADVAHVLFNTAEFIYLH